MSADTGLRPSDDRIAAMVRQYEVESFYYDEAALLDAHRYEEWLALFSDDAHYFMPIRRTRMQRELNKEFTQPGEMAFFHDDKTLLAGRVAKLKSGALVGGRPTLAHASSDHQRESRSRQRPRARSRVELPRLPHPA